MRAWSSPNVPTLDSFGVGPLPRVYDSSARAVVATSPQETARM